MSTESLNPSIGLEHASERSLIGTYIALTKPRIIELLLITTVPAMVLAASGWPGTWLVVATLFGGTLSAGGANVLNSYYDRDIDEVMRRTQQRPLAQHQVPPGHALVFGVVLGVLGFLWLWVTSNLLAAALATAALLFYVFVYTIVLKRTTVQNIVVGGAAGAAPVLVGWAAVFGFSRCARLGPLLCCLLLDTAPLLGAGIALQGRLCECRSADAPCGGGCGSDHPSDVAVHRAHGWCVAASRTPRQHVLDLPRGSGFAGCLVHLGHLACVSRT